jgi:hypothetical protein
MAAFSLDPIPPPDLRAMLKVAGAEPRDRLTFIAADLEGTDPGLFSEIFLTATFLRPVVGMLP